MTKIYKNPRFAAEVLDRLKSLLGLRWDHELAGALGIGRTTLSSHKARNTLDYPVIIDYCVTNGIDLDYLFSGKKTTTEKDTPSQLAESLITRIKRQVKEELKVSETMKKYMSGIIEQYLVKRSLSESRAKIEIAKKNKQATPE